MEALADQIAAHLRETPAFADQGFCQAQVVELAARAGWREARRLLLGRVLRGDPVEGRA
ncbi:hypothetical protein [Saccharopolyspora sp. 6M]|uniref:hypothetical protein n=1 Tax=Saccharopolyspora sp. 6M TaxID=2877237 RepID=UPI001CD6EA22|nr:hypothetical protein [Saccharopolyspora sp. 6M]MCA1229949.1 hypothetical protein [Saccharopolyspora sp. 6M]